MRSRNQMKRHLDDYCCSEQRKSEETAPVKHRDGGVGSVVANHRGGGESSVVVTRVSHTMPSLVSQPGWQNREGKEIAFNLSIRQCTIATSVVQSELDYCNSLHYKLPNYQLSCLQQIQNPTVVKAPKLVLPYHSHPTQSLSVNECIEYKLLPLTDYSGSMFLQALVLCLCLSVTMITKKLWTDLYRKSPPPCQISPLSVQR